jgi:hypothetical protein
VGYASGNHSGPGRCVGVCSFRVCTLVRVDVPLDVVVDVDVDGM